MLPMPAKKKKRSFGKGGKKATINNPDTHHGTYDLPNASVRSYSEKAKPMKFAEGGTVESKKMMKKEIGFMKKKGAPKSMIKHEMAEAKGMACGGMTKKYAGGGSVAPSGVAPGSPSASRINRGPTGSVTVSPAKMARGGGVESHGKTKGMMVKMASGGSVSARADGVASKGKTNCKIC